MKPFFFEGSIGASKSLFNRALLVQSYFPNLKIAGDSRCEDVVAMKKAIYQLHTGQPIDCGLAGTVIRFMVLRASREKGEFLIKGSERLLERPHQELGVILDQLGVEHKIRRQHIKLISRGWQNPRGIIQINRNVSSQFASSFLLNCWNLDFDMEFCFSGEKLSESYWEMSLALARSLGMQIESTPDGFMISKNQKVIQPLVLIEPDYSSAFAVAAAAALNGSIQIKNFYLNQDSLQPDHNFLNIFDQMKIPYVLTSDELRVTPSTKIEPLEYNLKNTPDLFPVLAVLCSFAQGPSKLYGAPHLVHKESNRIQKIAELLNALGVKNEPLPDGMIIHGNSQIELPKKEFIFDPDHDHRIAMAAALFKILDAPIKIINPLVVNKSFPEFWTVLGVTP